jgi:predicted HNH restriction endonuclease
MASRGWGIAHIKEELRKCIPLCANCHRIEHT